MPDIFDQLDQPPSTGRKGDVFDKIAPPSLVERATGALKSAASTAKEALPPLPSLPSMETVKSYLPSFGVPPAPPPAINNDIAKAIGPESRGGQSLEQLGAIPPPPAPEQPKPVSQNPNPLAGITERLKSLIPTKPPTLPEGTHVAEVPDMGLNIPSVISEPVPPLRGANKARVDMDQAKKPMSTADLVKAAISAIGNPFTAEPAHEFTPPAEDVAKAIPYVAPFPTIAKAIGEGTQTIPKVEVPVNGQMKPVSDVGALLNPIPEIVSDAFRKVGEGLTSIQPEFYPTLGADAAKLLGDYMGNIPGMPKAPPGAYKTGLAGVLRRGVETADTAAENRAFARARDVTPQEEAMGNRGALLEEPRPLTPEYFGKEPPAPEVPPTVQPKPKPAAPAGELSREYSPASEKSPEPLKEAAKTPRETSPKTEEPPTLTSDQVVSRIEDQQNPEFFDKNKITEQVEKGGDKYVKVEVDPDELKTRKGVKPGVSQPEKGAIVVDDKGKVIDGNHRAVDAKAAGEETIPAYVPADSQLASTEGIQERIAKLEAENQKLRGETPETKQPETPIEEQPLGKPPPAHKGFDDTEGRAADLAEQMRNRLAKLQEQPEMAPRTPEEQAREDETTRILREAEEKGRPAVAETKPEISEAKVPTGETTAAVLETKPAEGETPGREAAKAKAAARVEKAKEENGGGLKLNQPPPGGWTDADKVPPSSLNGISVRRVGRKVDDDNIRYELFHATDNTGRAVVRQTDIDSGNTILIKTFPTAKQAQANYDLLGTVGPLERKESEAPKVEQPAQAAQPSGEDIQALLDNYVKKIPAPSRRDYAAKYLNWVSQGRQGTPPQGNNLSPVAVTNIRAVIDGQLAAGVKGIDIPQPQAQIEKEGEGNGVRQPSTNTPGVDVREPAGTGAELSEGQQVERTREPARQETPIGTEPSAETQGERPERARRVRGGNAIDTGAERRPSNVGQPSRSPAISGAEEGVRETGSTGTREPEGRGAPEQNAPDVARQNYVLAKNEDFIPSGNKAKVRANLDAIKLLKKLEAEDRFATPEEKAVLAQYTGWGGLKEVFDEGKAAYRTRPGWNDEQRQEAANFEKNWGKLYDDVKAELTPEERAAAARSILNAHYTSREVINSIWDAVEKLGFKGGNALEPATGVGHFIGLEPDDVRASTEWRGTELDSVSARIAQKLYPEARIEHTGFQDAKIPVNSQDLVITNVPFAAEGPKSKTNPDNLSLHNFFISRGLDLLKPGKIMAVITSDSTMDGGAASAKARKIIADKADLVGAIRLPNTAFKKNAGTEVTTDVLFFRKKDGGGFQGEDFKHTVQAETYKGEPVTINEYFANHPDMMLGRMSNEGTMYREGRQALLPTPGADLNQQLTEAISKLPSNIMSGGATRAEKVAPKAYAGNEKIGSMIEKDGKIKLVGADKELADPEWANNPKKVAQAKQYISVRDLTGQVIDLQLSPEATDDAIAASRKKLNALYDSYVKKYGPINERASSFLDDDIDFPLALALEDDVTRLEETRRGGKNVTRKVTEWKKSKIFSERTLFPREAPESVDTVPDALQVSMNYQGRVDPDYIAELTKQPVEKVKKELLNSGEGFENPVNGLWESRAEYLSGFVKQKLREAKDAAETDPRFQKNVSELEKVQPKPIFIDNIGFKLGSRWLPPEAIQKFIKDTLDVDATVSLTKETGDWHVTARYGGYSQLNQTVHGVHGKTGISLIEDSLNLKTAKVMKPEERTREDGTTYISMVRDPEKSLEAEQKQAELQKLFKDYIRKSPELSKELEQLYNEQFNGVVAPKFEPPTWAHYPNASNDITLYEHQKAVVTRMLQNSTLLAHAVGTGKTYAMTTAAMEQRRLGLAKKPMIVVQNATLEQFARSFKRLYPAARILAPNAKQRDAVNRNKTMSRIATGDWDAVIVPQSFVNMLPDDPRRESQFIQDQIDKLEAAKIEAVNREGKRSPKASDLQKAVNRLEDRLSSLAERKKDKGLTFEQLGVDSLFVDEAHAYKKLQFTTQMDNIKGLDTGASQRGLSMYMKTRWVQEKNQGRNVVFATGTPVSNTLAEAWNMMRYVRPDVFEKYGIEDFDSFAGTFGDTVTGLEMTAGGTWKPVTRFARFTNGPELISAWRTVADVVTPEEVNLKGLPAVKGGGPRQISLDQSPQLKSYVGYLRSELERFAKMSGREKREYSYIPLVVFGLAKKASLDMRMIDPAIPDQPGSKLNRAADEILRIYKESTPVKGAQMVFSDSYQNNPENPQFNLYTALKEKLIERGIPENQIAIINADMKDAKREALFEKVNAGDTRVVIGSTERMGVGVNAQEKLIALHHLDAPPRPMDIEQRNGRILRQGNTNPEIEIINYGVKDTLDAAMYQKLATKQKFINQILRGEISGRFFEDPANEQSLTFEEQMAAFSGDKRAMEKVGLENQVRQLEGLRKGHTEQVRKGKETLADLKHRGIPTTKHLLEQADKRSDEFSKAFPAGAELRLKVDGKTYEGRKEVVEALDKYIKDTLAEVKKKEGEFGPFNRDYADLVLNGKDINATLKIPASSAGMREFDDASFEWRFAGTNVAPGRFKTGQGLLQGLSAQLEAIDRTPKLLRDDLAGKERSVRELSTFVETPFQRETELATAKERLKSLTEELKGEGEKKAEAEPESEDTGETLESLDAVSAENQAEVQKERSQEKQRGSLTGRKVREAPSVEELLTGGQKLAGVLSTTELKRSTLADFKERFMRVFEYEREVKDNPQFVDALRRFQGARQRAFHESGKDLDGIVGGLKNRRELERVAGIVQLRDMISRLKSGQRVQGGVDLEQAEAGLKRLTDNAPPEIMDTVKKHFKVVKAIGEEKVERGWMKPEAVRDDYFRHRVLMYADKNRIGRPSRIRPPGKEPAAKGSTLPIERDYLKVMFDYIAEHRFKKALDDFIDTQAKKLDKSKEVEAAMGEGFKLKPGQIVEIDGKRIKGFQFDPGNYIYPEITEVDAAVNHGIKKAMEGDRIEDIDAMQEGGEPETVLKKKLIIGRKKPTYALPVNVANRLERFGGPNVDSDFVRAINKATGKWKGLTIAFGGTAFQIANAMGDIANIARADAGSLGYLPKAAKMMLGKSIDGKLMLKLAEELDVINSGFIGSEVTRLLDTPEFKRFLPKWKKITNAPAVIGDRILAINEFRENIPRLALFLKNAARLEGGLQKITDTLKNVTEGEPLSPALEKLRAARPLKTGEVNVEGLEPIYGAGKVAREIPTDYRKFTEDENKYLRGMFLPFYAWTKDQASGWARFGWKHPWKFTAMVIAPWVMMELWNNIMFPEQEDGLKKYLKENPHLITGFRDKDGKMIVLDLGALPQAAVARVFGTQGVPSTLSQLMREKITLSKAARKIMADIGTAPIDTITNLLTPFLKIPYEVGADKNLFSGGKIVPGSKEGTDEAAKLKTRYAVEGLFRPAREARAILDQIQEEKYDVSSSRYGMGLPLRKSQGEGWIEQFYDMYRDAEQSKKTEALYRRQRRTEDRRDYRQENREDIQLARPLKQTADRLAQLQRAKDIVREDKELTPDAKRIRMDALTTRMVEYAKEAVEREGHRAVANQ